MTEVDSSIKFGTIGAEAVPSPTYEAWAILSETELVSLQPLGADHATLPHMKAMHVPFHLVYGSLISFKGLQSDRPKCRGMSVNPRRTQ